jgi:predicted transcriptional regulator of viral defense system
VNFRDFQLHAKDLPVFNLNDVRKFDPDFHRQQLNDWLNRGYIQSLAGGFYLLADVQVDESYLFMLANRIYEPSYISRESALAYYLVIPESVLVVTSVSSRKTKQFDSEWGRFSYSSIKPALMFGYRVVVLEKMTKYKIASLEKAVLDYLYWNNRIDSYDDFAGLRWNKQELLRLEDNPLFKKYLKIFDNKALDRRADQLMEYIHA